MQEEMNCLDFQQRGHGPCSCLQKYIWALSSVLICNCSAGQRLRKVSGEHQRETSHLGLGGDAAAWPGLARSMAGTAGSHSVTTWQRWELKPQLVRKDAAVTCDSAPGEQRSKPGPGDHQHPCLCITPSSTGKHFCRQGGIHLPYC